MANVQTEKKITLTITTPRGVKFVETADMIVLRSIDGELGVLPGHEPVSTVMGDGVLRIKNDGIEKYLAVFGGIVEISSNAVNILTTIAQSPDEIDLERAEEDRQEAEATIQEEFEEHMTQRLQVKQIRALVRIRVSQTDFFPDSDNDDDDDE